MFEVPKLLLLFTAAGWIAQPYSINFDFLRQVPPSHGVFTSEGAKLGEKEERRVILVRVFQKSPFRATFCEDFRFRLENGK